MVLFNRLLKKIIHTGAGRGRFLIAVTGVSIAVLLLLLSVQVQSNYQDLIYSKSNQDSIANFLVLHKRLTDQNLGSANLTDKEIEDLKKQVFVESAGLLTASHFKASIQSKSDRFPFYTDIAFESVPKAFIDVDDKDWKWDENAPLVPIIVPNMFLDFYNFQFSFSQNLPQLTQGVVKMIVFKINVYGQNGTISFNGRVVGFSDRISSILVPEDFMKWGNKHFGIVATNKSSRVIIRTKDPGNPELNNYLKSKGLDTDKDKTRFSKYRQVVDWVVRIFGVAGLIMLSFALLIFSLFIQLTVASCKEEINLLIVLGTSPKQLRRFLMKQFFPIHVYIVAFALSILTGLQYFVYGRLQAQQISVGAFPAITVFICAGLILASIWFLNNYFISKYIRLTGLIVKK